jgi:hypothetical protein
MYLRCLGTLSLARESRQVARHLIYAALSLETPVRGKKVNALTYYVSSFVTKPHGKAPANSKLLP